MAADTVLLQNRCHVLGEIDLEPELRIVPEEAGLMIFSAAHLHSTVPNESDSTRISIDFRTVHRSDLMSHGGATNVDSQCTGSTIQDYLRATDFEQLPDELISNYMNLVPNPQFESRTAEPRTSWADSQ